MPVSRSAALQPASFPKELERPLVELLLKCGSKGRERVVDAFSAQHAGPSKRQVRGRAPHALGSATCATLGGLAMR